MRRKEEKREAKRLANRKSASTSRARKKALIEEMTKDNARLRRQALILSFLPDPVVAISTDGVITFCSMQVERVLKHEVSGLIGANIEDIIVPSSRESIRRLIRDLIIAEQRALSSSVEEEENDGTGHRGENDQSEEGGSGARDSISAAAMLHEISGNSSEQNCPPLLEVKVKEGSADVAAGEDVSDSSGDPPSKNGADQSEEGGSGARDSISAAAMLHEISGNSSEQNCPPLLEVKVKEGSADVAAGEDVSDSSGDPPSKNGAKSSEMSSLTHKNSSLGPESGEDQQQPPAKKVKTCDDAAISDEMKPSTESDDSTSSAKKASANLSKNVEMCKLNKEKAEGDEQVRFAHKDDVMGASVTANNADAKLSSLMHHPKEKGDKSSTEKNLKEEKLLKLILGKQDSSSADSSSLSKTKKRSGNSSEDSGYRESNESPEESNEYPEDSSSSSSGASSGRPSSKKKREWSYPLSTNMPNELYPILTSCVFINSFQQVREHVRLHQHVTYA